MSMVLHCITGHSITMHHPFFVMLQKLGLTCSRHAHTDIMHPITCLHGLSPCSTVFTVECRVQEAQAPRPADMAYSQTASPSEAPQPRLNMLQGAYASFGQQGQLIGREELQAKLTDLLKDPHRRHTVLVGGPGMVRLSTAADLRAT